MVTYEKYNTKCILIKRRRHTKLTSKLPNFELRDHDGTLLEERWERCSPLTRVPVLHRFNNPALIKYHKGKPYAFYYFENGVFKKSKYQDIPE